MTFCLVLKSGPRFWAGGDCGACTLHWGAPGDFGKSWHQFAFFIFANGRWFSGSELSGETELMGFAPVQKAMGDADASQCGFCTPVF
ncbi:MAG: hypothetical protein CM15mP95_2670 [Alphaproteobacteria bacterium]|nr:MAG: hypothetical protein CM15mP95_2670 [Alphaproteobacteria bacterium]